MPEGQQAPAVTKAQAERIIARIAATAADADAAMDAALAATRLDGAVLAERETNYKLRGALPDYAAPAAIPTKPLEIVLPQAYDGWPRSVMAVVNDEADKTASIMLMTQEDAWSPYKLTYLASLEAATQMPDLAPAYIGAQQVPPDSSFLVMAPDELAAAYADMINKGESSEYYDHVRGRGRPVPHERGRRPREAPRGRSTRRRPRRAACRSTPSPGTHPPLALATLESGAIVAVNVNETDTVKPTNADAVIKLDDNPTVKTLAGAEQSATGFTTTFSDQLFFYVPGLRVEREDPPARLRFRHPRREGDQVTDVTPGAALRGAVDLSALRNRPAPRRARCSGAAPASAPSLVMDVTDETFPQVLELSRTVPVVIDLWAEWCGPCKQLSPILERVVPELGGRLVLAKVDVDANPQLSQAFRAQSIPMVVALVAGQPVPLFTGAVPEQQVREVFAQLLQLAAQNGVTGSIDVSGEEDATADAEPVEPALPPLHAEAFDAIEAGDYPRAIAAYEKALAENPRDAEARAGLGQVRCWTACRAWTSRRLALPRRPGRRMSTRSSPSPISISRADTSTTRSRACSTCSRRCRPTSARPCASACSSCSRSSATPTRACFARAVGSPRCCSRPGQGSSSRPVLA